MIVFKNIAMKNLIKANFEQLEINEEYEKLKTKN